MSRGELPGPPPEERMTPDGRRTEQGIREEPSEEATHPPERTVLSALVVHEPGVLAEVSGLFSRRQYNIESLTVGPTTDENRARMTIVVEESRPNVDQVKKQLEKQIPVISVRELDDAARRELVVLKVDGQHPEKVNAITDMYGGRTVDAGPQTVTVELTGETQTVDAAIDAYRQFGIRELARTGEAALARGERPTAQAEEPTRGQTGPPTTADD